MNLYFDLTLNFVQNYPIFFIFGSGSVIYGIVKLVKVFLKHKRANDERSLPERKLAHEKVKEAIQIMKNNQAHQCFTTLQNKKLSFVEMHEISEEVHNLFTKESRIFLENSEYFEKKIYEKIKKLNVEYRVYCEANKPAKNVQVDDLDDIKDVLKACEELNEEIDKVPNFIKMQLHLYLQFSQMLFLELQNSKKKYANQLGI